eukprot:CAMPEP_0177517318 /NCGR_PEP_ID=MMETSP0369-20130122/45909_1 /TAXON_ID=447022 ORGANISM="Scrippsiella hangoei-like, Strain SHHI-4" /NCGR_SAMPLE_ID=MMETSP0369 /ASSEMBLY_ACC=CAM_ASM_000364 /LENGTH=38 /DNA_ID= /DNA_START= /DNA_END= /DNA_ORIENTATION=
MTDLRNCKKWLCNHRRSLDEGIGEEQHQGDDQAVDRQG